MFRLTTKQVFQLFLVVLLTGIVLRMFVIDSFIVKGNSMAPLILENDYVFVNKFAYAFGYEPKRNDIIVSRFRDVDPNAIKRVIGLPRERVEISPEKIVVKKNRDDDGVTLPEDAYLALANFPLNGSTTITLDPQEYFILGDNRFVSTDSRELGPVDKWDIAGRVFLVFRLRTFSFFTP
ncbi:MAG: signal peptidase I [Parcubacteria group bacterium]|nr:signal peptidase I [Parcubacteria group bacterium]